MPTGSFIPSRRGFLKTATLAAAATGLPNWFIQESMAQAADAEANRPRSANDKPHILLIGCGGQGRGDANGAKRFANVVAVCDVDAHHAAAAAGGHPGAKVYHDFRKALEHPGIDAVIDGCPDHWHTLVNIAAMRAGKDVYGEKPLTLTIDEGHHVIRTAKETKRVFQTGTQQRSDDRFRLACELVRNGRIGRVHPVGARIGDNPKEGPFPVVPVPKGLDWDFWQGPTPDVPYVKERCHYTFRWWYEYSGGKNTDWGAHQHAI